MKMMRKNRKRIGLVLSQAPAISETFLMSKITGLINNGFEVIVFSGKKSRVPFTLCREVVAYQVPRNPVARLADAIAVITVLLVKCPIRLFRFLRLEVKSGIASGQVIRRLYNSAHILPYSLDYLHFGFCTLGVGKENIGKAVGAKTSASLRGYDVCIFPLTRVEPYRLLWKSLDRVHTISEDLYREALKIGLATSVPCVKIMPAIDAKKFVGPRETSSDAPLKILTVARLQWKKGLGVAIEAMSHLKTRGVKFKYTIVGEGREYDQLCFARYQLGLEKEITFAGLKKHDEIAVIMKTNDIYLQPSVQEGFCNAVLEAQASGLLCIVTDAEGLPENVLDGETGWVVPKWDAVALADAVVKVSSLPTTDKRRIIDRAVSRVLNEFNIEKQNSLFAEFFQY